jgi:hypothetical protein
MSTYIRNHASTMQPSMSGAQVSESNVTSQQTHSWMHTIHIFALWTWSRKIAIPTTITWWQKYTSLQCMFPFLSQLILLIIFSNSNLMTDQLPSSVAFPTLDLSELDDWAQTRLVSPILLSPDLEIYCCADRYPRNWPAASYFRLL